MEPTEASGAPKGEKLTIEKIFKENKWKSFGVHFYFPIKDHPHLHCKVDTISAEIDCGIPCWSNPAFLKHISYLGLTFHDGELDPLDMVVDGKSAMVDASKLVTVRGKFNRFLEINEVVGEKRLEKLATYDLAAEKAGAIVDAMNAAK